MVIALKQPLAQPPGTGIAMTSAVLPTPSLLTQRMVISGNWEQFELVRQGCEQSKCVRLSYYDGTIEIVMPGLAHELFKTVIALLIEAYLLDWDREFMPMGSVTQKVETIASAEADESYEIAGLRLSIEVTVTSGDISKLLTYKALGVDEVWFWEDGVLTFYHLVNGDYVCVDRSQIPELSGVDRAVLTSCVLMGETSRVQAMRTFRSAHPL